MIKRSASRVAAECFPSEVQIFSQIIGRVGLCICDLFDGALVTLRGLDGLSIGPRTAPILTVSGARHRAIITITPTGREVGCVYAFRACLSTATNDPFLRRAKITARARQRSSSRATGWLHTTPAR